MVSFVRSTSSRRLDLSRRCKLEMGYQASALEVQRSFNGIGISRKDVKLGGTESNYFGDDQSLKNDVRVSSDGLRWECVTTEAVWGPRA
jgi:hypothetical protein